MDLFHQRGKQVLQPKALLSKHPHLPSSFQRAIPTPIFYLSSLTAPTSMHSDQNLLQISYHYLLRIKLHILSISPVPGIWIFFRKTWLPQGMLCTMKRSLSFSLEQLPEWKANSPPRCLPSPHCVFSEIHTEFSVGVSGIYLEPLQLEPPWCRAVGECVCVSVSVCVYLFPAKREMEESSKLSYGLLEVSQISNNWKRFFFFFFRPYESRCGVSGGGGWGRKKKEPKFCNFSAPPARSSAPLPPAGPCLSVPRWDCTSQEWASEWRFLGEWSWNVNFASRGSRR